MRSYSYLNSGPIFSLLWPLIFLPLYQIFSTVILFYVNVPVLSEQIQEVEPKVSTPSKFLTKTFNPANFLAVNVKATTTVAKRPSGTFATIIPIANIRLVTAAKE